MVSGLAPSPQRCNATSLNGRPSSRVFNKSGSFLARFPLISQQEAGPFFRMIQGVPRRAQDSSAAGHLPALLTPTLLVVSTDGHGLQRRFDQAESNTEVMEPVL